MLTKAVQQHSANSASKSTLAQALFPSSSPSSTYQSGRTGTTPSPSFPADHQASDIRKALKPGSSNILKVLCRESVVNNSLKRTAAQASLGEHFLRGQGHPSNRDSPLGGIRSSGVRGSMETLCNTVYFDENDFVDDADIDIDADDDIPAFRSALPATALTTASTATWSTSSTAIPWSSSPSGHLADLTGEAGPAESNNSIARNSEPLPPSEATRESSPQRSSKKRRLPWLENNVSEGHEDSKPTSRPAPHKSAGNKKRNDGDSSFQKIQASTPLQKDTSKTSYMWNTTASAMKIEQKKHRQANVSKKIIKGGETEEPRRTTIPKIFLSEEQKKVLQFVAEEKRSVFYTGSAGTGKSVLLREIIRVLAEKYTREPDRVAVTASTGLAACNVGGITLHSFSGIGLGKEAVPHLVRKIRRNQKALNRWLRTKVLIIDEISMVDGDLFDKLEEIARTIRKSGMPFGGIQLVITGDFFQLPPVPDYGKVAKFAFDAKTWQPSIDYTIRLTQVFRQKDPVFANMLNEMRLGKLTQQAVNSFRSLCRPLASKDDLEATELFPTRQEVDNANNLRLNNLDGTLVAYRATDGGTETDITRRDKLLTNCMAPQSIALKIGAQVMLIKNMDDSLVNGSVGKVVNFMDEKTYENTQDDEAPFRSFDSGPSSEEKDEMEESKKRLKGMMYKDQIASTSQKWPYVRFSLPDGTSRGILCRNESWKIELPTGEVQASRSQVPLILAWALSIHKAQGQTLERVKVDLGRIFEKGQAYVALSRATSQEGLQIMRFDPKKVMAHDRVRTFYDSLLNVEEVTRDQPAYGS